jgi:hypothetical protein
MLAALVAQEANVPGADTAAFVVSAPVVTIILGTLIPLVTGILTKATLSPGIKGIITVVLNAVAAAVTTAVVADGSAVFSNQALLTFALGLVASTAAYYNVWNPNKLTSNPDGKLAPNSGIGPSA